MSIHPHTYGDGREGFQVRFRQGGRNRSRRFDPKKYGGKRAAERAAQAFEAQLNVHAALGQDFDPNRGRVLLRDMADEWWELHVERKLDEEWTDAYATQLDLRVLPRWGDHEVRAIHAADIERWVADLERAGVGKPTIVKTLTVLQGILKRAVIARHITVNPVEQIDKPDQQRARAPVMIEPLVIERARGFLLDRERVEDATLLCTLAYSGPRPESEGVLLAWERVRRTSLTYVETKRGQTRMRPTELLAPLAEDLAVWRAESGNPIRGAVFPRDWTGHAWDNWRDRVFRPAMIAAGVEPDVERRMTRRGKTKIVQTTSLRPRDLRASFVSLRVWEGRDVVTIAKETGHSPETLLRHYADVFASFDPTAKRPAVDVIREARAAAEGWEPIVLKPRELAA